MENVAIARVLAEIGDLLEIRGDNPFKVRAYRNASQVVRDCGERVASLSAADLRGLPGIGKDIATRVTELIETGGSTFHRELAAEFPAGLLDVLRLQGVGPKTTALLYKELRIGSVDELKLALDSGSVRGVKGMGPGKEAALRKAIEDHQAFAGRYLASEVWQQAHALITHLRTVCPDATFDLVGSLRRGAETCGDLDVLATGAGPEVMEHFVAFGRVERVLGQGPTKSSVRLGKGLQADLRLVPPASRGAALQYFTGSKAHNIELRDRAVRLGLKLNEYGLFRLEDDIRIAGDSEANIYEALGLPWIAPELREQRGEFEAARDGRLPALVERDDLRGDLHCHTTATDGKDTIRAMALAARDAGLSYLAITDHSQALAMANGLDEDRALAHAARVRAIGDEIDGITLLAGIECDIRADGTMDLADDCLAQLDVVIASVHSALSQEPERMTERVLRALECPYVDVLGHPTGRMLLRREASGLDVEAVIAQAARLGVALEINGQPHRRDLHDGHARLARDRGVKIVLSSDAHAVAGFEHLHWATFTARRAWLTPQDVLTCLPLVALRSALRRHRSHA
ncbi:DNA polymerase/3'-5' exonuclease PolX [Luteitalea pratensis]|uniref:DNA polymerase beta n=1 Tax=Luteitalea pratensis TaxID=1855912 RepID=A0A143PT23_LUTPR|nr:DNA polymerase/3'-5' exonuclease PolX [Luteitalea pratensis]AMY10964.1 DNA polymerase/3'-5' exonuclease PolX [Luteitalea pratensis]